MFAVTLEVYCRRGRAEAGQKRDAELLANGVTGLQMVAPNEGRLELGRTAQQTTDGKLRD